MSIERKLWLQLDSEPGESAQVLSLLVLADFYEEIGKASVANFLRNIAGTGNLLPSFYFHIAEAKSLKKIIQKLEPKTARLFACHVVLLDPSDSLLEKFSCSIVSAINVEFGLTSLKQNELEQKKAYVTYLQVNNELENLSTREKRQRGWKTIQPYKEELWSFLRASGAISIALNAIAPAVDAMFTAKFSQAED